MTVAKSKTIVFSFRSEILQRGVERLIKQTIDQKSKSFQTRVEGVVQNYLYESNREKRERFRKPNRVSESKNEMKSSGSEAASSKIDASQLLTSKSISTLTAPTVSKTELHEVPHTVMTTHSRIQSHGTTIFSSSSTVQSVALPSTSSSKQDRNSVVRQTSAIDSVRSPGSVADSFKQDRNSVVRQTSAIDSVKNPGSVADSFKQEVKTEISKWVVSEAQQVHSAQRCSSPVFGKKPQLLANKEAKNNTTPTSSESVSSTVKRSQLLPPESTEENSNSNIKTLTVIDDGNSGVKITCDKHDMESVEEKANSEHFHSDNSKEERDSKVCEMKSRLGVDDDSGIGSCDKEDSMDAAVGIVAGENEITGKENLETQYLDGNSVKESRLDSLCVEASLSESDISEISSVHTSDLSSFDDDVSSVSSIVSENAVEDDRIDKYVDPPKQQDANEAKPPSPSLESLSGDEKPACGVRRSRRISSRRSTKDSDDQPELQKKERHSQTSEEKKANSEKHPGTKKIKLSVQDNSQTSSGQVRSTEVPQKRHRGRPRKDEQQKREKSSFGRASRRAVREVHEDAAGSVGSSSGLHVRHRSKRTVKRKRCYSPSSEGTREISLPSKKTRLSRD